MKLSRTTRFVAAMIAVISLLFTQLALASYVCPGMTMPERMTMASADDGMSSMDHCTGMDMAQPNLCRAHHHADLQSLDKPDLPQVPPFHAIGSALTLVLFDAAAPPPTALAAIPALAYATAPPVAILHCCFRI